MLNEVRRKNGLRELELIYVDMIYCEEKPCGDKFSNKTSSTYIR